MNSSDLRNSPNNYDFIMDDQWRLLRILSEFAECFEEMGSQPHKLVSIFGSARTPKTDPNWKSANELGKLLVQNGYGVITGGGPGIMGAGNEGAYKKKGISIGVNIKLPREQHENKYQTNSLTCRYFFTRKVTFLKYSLAVFVFPGGFGTMDEFFEVLTMIQTKKIHAIPLILVGKKFWGGLEKWMRDQMIPAGVISPEEMNLFHTVDSAREAMDLLLKFHHFGASGTVI